MVDEITLKTRQHFADICQQCIDDTVSGIDMPNDPLAWIAYQECHKKLILNGDYDKTFTHLQYAEYLRTGECHALLP